ncbi:MAG: hypothetical protein LBI62_01525 [Candidatus Accumulibacter sp.]|jgi:hypothetical protein|nr:hypothetical protein [Accumulibacter sp.]
MEWTKETPVILYGAATVGAQIYNKLIGECNLFAFIDKRFDESTSHMGLPVHSVRSDGIPLKIKKRALVIVCVKNIFDHENIVIELLKHGYETILFFPVDESAFVYRDNDKRNRIMKLYNEMMECSVKLPAEVPSCKGLFYLGFEDSFFLSRCEGERIIAKIPLLFTNNRLVGNDIWSDIPMMNMFPHLEMFDYFAGKSGANPMYFVDEYCISAAKSANFIAHTEKWKSNILNNRRMVYERMRINEELSSSFFEEHTVSATWNERGYFNMAGGKHRAAYLLHKNRMLIPLTISEEDYSTYVNAEATRRLSKYILENSIFELPYPVLHPMFMKIPFVPESDFSHLLYAIVRKLSVSTFENSGKVTFQELRVLDRTGFMFPIVQCLSKLGCRCECLYEFTEFGVLVSNLYHIPIPVVSVSEGKGEYDLVFEESDESCKREEVIARKFSITACKDSEFVRGQPLGTYNNRMITFEKGCI